MLWENVVVGLIQLVVSILFAVLALYIGFAVLGKITMGINKALSVGLLSVDGLLAVGVAFAQLILGIVLAVAAIYLALNILDKLTKGVDEFEEIRKGNVAVALEMGGVIIAVAVIIQSGVIGITAALV